MGQAKQRGMYEQRQAQGEAKRAAAEAARRKQWAAEEAAMTPEQKAKRHDTHMTLAALAGLSAWGYN